MKSRLMTPLAAVTVLALPWAAGASPIAIDNPGFEIPVLIDGDYNWSMDDEGWGYVDNDGYQGSWNVATTDYPAEAPEGQNAGWANPGTNGPGGFAQVLTDANATLQAGMKYTLSVKVGKPLSYPSGGYLVQLLAGGTPHTPGSGADYTGPVTGGTLLAEDSNTVAITVGSFADVAVTYTYDPAHASLLGQPLQIRLLALPGEEEAETEFDDVKLDSETLPFRLTSIAITGSVANLAWESRAGMVYDVRGTSNATADVSSWPVVATNLTATPSTNTASITVSGSLRFYGVEEHSAPGP
jgi:hypothetical protein